MEGKLGDGVYFLINYNIMKVIIVVTCLLLKD